MKKLLLLNLSLILCGWGFSQSTSPEVNASSGEHFTSNMIQLSWTIGEILIETYDNGSNQLSQGFHQTDLIITAMNDLVGGIQVRVFPNPANGQLNIEWSELSEPFHILLHDTNGRQLLAKKIANPALYMTLDLSPYRVGTYFLHLNDPNEETVKTFKILKIK